MFLGDTIFDKHIPIPGDEKALPGILTCSNILIAKNGKTGNRATSGGSEHACHKLTKYMMLTRKIVVSYYQCLPICNSNNNKYQINLGYKFAISGIG